MEKRLGRQFVDSYSKYPLRFLVTNPETDETVGMHDFYYAPGEVSEVGTFINRGYFQPIEDFLYDSTEISEAISRTRALIVSNFLAINQSVTNLESQANSKLSDLNTTLSASYLRVIAVQNSLANYAPKSGANFTNPRANSPAAADNSTRIATTENVRNFVAQYPFPPKNVKNLSVTPGGLSLEVKWNDPADFAFDNMTLSEWSGTKLVYRTDRFPNSPTDGTVLVDNTWKDYYSDGFEILNLSPQLTYYFQTFPYTASGIYNFSTANRKSAIPLPAIIELADLTRHSGYYQSRDGLAVAKNGMGSIVFSGGGMISDHDPQAYSNFVDVYSTTGTKTTFTGLSYGRAFHTSSADGEGGVFIFGGYMGENVNTTNVNRYTTTGTRTTATAMTNAVNEHASIQGAYGKAIVTGGGRFSSPHMVSTVEEYSANGTKVMWTALTYARSLHGMSTDYNNSIWIAGGEDNNFNALSSIERYTSDGIKTTEMQLSVAGRWVTGAKDFDGNVYFFNPDGAHNAIVNKFLSSGTRIVLSNTTGHLWYGMQIADVTYDNQIVISTTKYTSTSDEDEMGSGLIERYAANGQKIESLTSEYMPSDHAGASDGRGNYVWGNAGIYRSGSAYKVQKYVINP